MTTPTGPTQEPWQYAPAKMRPGEIPLHDGRPCPTCWKPIAANARNCPHCGHAFLGLGDILLRVAAVALVAYVLIEFTGRALDVIRAQQTYYERRCGR